MKTTVSMPEVIKIDTFHLDKDYLYRSIVKRGIIGFQYRGVKFESSMSSADAMKLRELMQKS